MANKYQCMDSSEVKCDDLTKTGGEITVKGWNIPNPEKIVLDELEEYYEDEDIIDFEIVKKKEHAFACQRFYEEQDAKDEGYNYWLEYSDVWKKGLGKCTTFIVKYKLKEKVEEIEA